MLIMDLLKAQAMNRSFPITDAKFGPVDFSRVRHGKLDKRKSDKILALTNAATRFVLQKSAVDMMFAALEDPQLVTGITENLALPYSTFWIENDSGTSSMDDIGLLCESIPNTSAIRISSFRRHVHPHFKNVESVLCEPVCSIVDFTNPTAWFSTPYAKLYDQIFNPKSLGKINLNLSDHRLYAWLMYMLNDATFFDDPVHEHAAKMLAGHIKIAPAVYDSLLFETEHPLQNYYKILSGTSDNFSTVGFGGSDLFIRGITSAALQICAVITLSLKSQLFANWTTNTRDYQGGKKV